MEGGHCDDFEDDHKHVDDNFGHDRSGGERADRRTEVARPCTHTHSVLYIIANLSTLQSSSNLSVY